MAVSCFHEVIVNAEKTTTESREDAPFEEEHQDLVMQSGESV